LTLFKASQPAKGTVLENPQASYYCARYYNPQLQRFISEDPLRLAAKTVNFYQYTYDSPTNFRDPSGLYTFQIGLTLNGTLPLGPIGWTFSVSSGFAIDTEGHIAVVNTYTPFGGLGEGAGGSGGISFAVSNARTVCGLGGPFINISGTGGYGLWGTGDYFTGPGDGPNGIVDGVGGTFGLGGGASASVTATQTGVHPFGRYSCGQDGRIHAQ
jgi:RHS repeat-associated protein